MSDVRAPTTSSGSTRTFAPGTRLGRYRVGHRLGVGGMAEVYLAVADGPQGFQKRVALKLLHSHAANDADRIAELFREARVAATLEHPNIAQVLDVGSDRGEFFLAMEYVHGRDVRDLLASARPVRPLSLDCAIFIVAEAARGLAYAHDQSTPEGKPLGLVHRDISPSNVLVSHEGAVKVVDFGLAKVDTSSVDTQTGVLKGKFGYMSPEQTRGQRVDRRSDVYALGILLYELTLGRRAFTGMNAFEIMNKVLAGTFAPPREIDPDYPAALEAIVVRAMALQPAHRYQTAKELEHSLHEFAHGHGIQPSAEALARLMEARFGSRRDPPVLDFPPEADDDGTVTTVLEPRTRSLLARSGRPRVLTAAVTASVCAGALGWWLGAGRASPPEPQATPSQAPTVTTPTAVATPPPPTPSPSKASSRPHDETTVGATPTPAKTPPVNTSASSARNSKKASKRKRTQASSPKRAKSSNRAASDTKKTDRAKPESEERDLSSMFPPPLQ